MTNSGCGSSIFERIRASVYPFCGDIVDGAPNLPRRFDRMGVIGCDQRAWMGITPRGSRNAARG